MVKIPRKKKRGRPKKKTLYKPAKHKYLQQIVSFENPTKARESVKKLRLEFHTAKTKAKKLRIARATMYAGNRAKATTKKKALSTKERNEFKQIGNIYQTEARKMFDSKALIKKV